MGVILTGEGLKISTGFCELFPTATESNDSTGSRCFSTPGILS